ncbi:MAG: hypothetical protein ACKO6N_25770 [Myxococcota bacterium]
MEQQQNLGGGEQKMPAESEVSKQGGWTSRGLLGMALLVWMGSVWVGAQGFFEALQQVPLDAYGLGGGEVLPHLQRLYAERHVAQGGGFYELLGALDGQYPALLHLLAVFWRRWLGGGLEDFPLIAGLNLLLLPLGALSVGHALVRSMPVILGARGQGQGARGEAVQGEEARPAWQKLWVAAWVLLLPGLIFPARRYYYDLPMTVGILGVGGLLLGSWYSTRGARWIQVLAAAVLTGVTLLIKWAAVLYLLPIWGVGLTGWWWGGPRTRARALEALMQGGISLGLLLVGLWPLLTKPDGSFQFMRGVGGPQEGLLSQPLAALQYQLGTSWDAGLGPLGSVLVLLSLALGLQQRRRWPVLWRLSGVLLALTLPPLLYIVLFVREWDGRYLMPLLPWWMGWGLLLLPEQVARGRQLVLPLVVVLGLWAQHAWLDAHRHARAQEWWLERWWLGRADARASLLPSVRPVVRQVVGLNPERRVLVATERGGPDVTLLVQYLLELETEGRAVLVSWPPGGGLERWRAQLVQEAEVLLISGEPVAPERWGGLYDEVPLEEGPGYLHLYVRR